jgi:SulP family sulfate permease
LTLVPKSFESLRQYDRPTFYSDLAAGLTVGVVALPLAMAFAIASGVGPERGLYTAIVAGFLISLLGGSKVQIGGPTGAFVVIVAGIVARHGYEGLALCTVMAGAMLMVMGLSRLGATIKFIPFPVVTGFTSGIAVVIFTTQVKDLLGLRIGEVSSEFFDRWGAYLNGIGTTDAATATLGIGTIVGIAALRRLWPRSPAMLLAMIGATAAAALLGMPVETIGDRFGDLPRTLPMPRVPVVTLEQLRELSGPALTVALLAAIESLLAATVADGMIGSRHKSNMELVAQGAANVASGMMGGIPATGAIARTITNIKAGGKTPVAGMIHAVVLLLVLLAAAPLAKLVPMAALAGILTVVSYNMSEIEHFKRLLRGPRSDTAVLLITFGLTVAVDLTVAVQVGVVLAALLFMRRMSEVTNIAVVRNELRDSEEDTDDPLSIRLREVPEGVDVYEINGPFFFGAAERFKDAMSRTERQPTVLILRMRKVPVIDATGLELLRELHGRCRREGTALLLSGVHAQPIMAMTRSGLVEVFGDENLFGNIDEALERARELVGERRRSRVEA